MIRKNILFAVVIVFLGCMNLLQEINATENTTLEQEKRLFWAYREKRQREQDLASAALNQRSKYFKNHVTKNSRIDLLGLQLVEGVLALNNLGKTDIGDIRPEDHIHGLDKGDREKIAVIKFDTPRVVESARILGSSMIPSLMGDITAGIEYIKAICGVSEKLGYITYGTRNKNEARAGTTITITEHCCTLFIKKGYFTPMQAEKIMQFFVLRQLNLYNNYWQSADAGKVRLTTQMDCMKLDFQLETPVTIETFSDYNFYPEVLGCTQRGPKIFEYSAYSDKALIPYTLDWNCMVSDGLQQEFDQNDAQLVHISYADWNKLSLRYYRATDKGLIPAIQTDANNSTYVALAGVACNQSKRTKKQNEFVAWQNKFILSCGLSVLTLSLAAISAAALHGVYHIIPPSEQRAAQLFTGALWSLGALSSALGFYHCTNAGAQSLKREQGDTLNWTALNGDYVLSVSKTAAFAKYTQTNNAESLRCGTSIPSIFAKIDGFEDVR